MSAAPVLLPVKYISTCLTALVPPALVQTVLWSPCPHTHLCDRARHGAVPALPGDGGGGGGRRSPGLEGGHGLTDPGGEGELLPELDVGAALG